MGDVDIPNFSRYTCSRPTYLSVLCGSLFIFVHKYGKRMPCRSQRFPLLFIYENIF